MTSLLSLAQRCEAATGPDRELDLAIHLALYPESEISELMRYGRGFDHCAGTSWEIGVSEILFESWRDGRCYANGGYPLRRYSQSLDAALTLVPEGWSHLMAWNARGCVCDVHSRPLGDFDGTWPAHARAATPALALCAAALKARAETDREARK